MRNGCVNIPNIKNSSARTFDYAAGVCYHNGKATERSRV